MYGNLRLGCAESAPFYWEQTIGDKRSADTHVHPRVPGVYTGANIAFFKPNRCCRLAAIRDTADLITIPSIYKCWMENWCRHSWRSSEFVQ